LCEGQEACPRAVIITCLECGAERQPEDIDIPGPCPVCRSDEHTLNRCTECPVDRLSEAMNCSSRSSLLRRAIDLDFGLTAGFAVTLDEIDFQEWTAIRVIHDERTRMNAENNANGRQ
jgi:hypothetical protein